MERSLLGILATFRDEGFTYDFRTRPGGIVECGTERPLWLMTHPDNRGSQRVAEKAGFRRVGLERHDPPFRDGTTEAVKFELD